VLIAALVAGTLGMFGLARAPLHGDDLSDVLGPFLLLGLGLGPVITSLSAAAPGGGPSRSNRPPWWRATTRPSSPVARLAPAP
jgi:hypothetical protein